MEKGTEGTDRIRELLAQVLLVEYEFIFYYPRIAGQMAVKPATAR